MVFLALFAFVEVCTITTDGHEIGVLDGMSRDWYLTSKGSQRDKTIALFHQTDLSDPEKMEDALDWLVQQTIIFYNVFSKEVKGIK